MFKLNKITTGEASLLRALSFSLYSSENYYLNVFEKSLAAVCSNWNYYKQFILGETENSYFLKKIKSGLNMTEVEISALSNSEKINIFIYKTRIDKLYYSENELYLYKKLNNFNDGNKDIHLLLNDNFHYDLLSKVEKNYDSISIMFECDNVEALVQSTSKPDIVLYIGILSQRNKYLLEKSGITVYIFKETNCIINCLNILSVKNRYNYMKLYILAYPHKYTNKEYLLLVDTYCIFERNIFFDFLEEKLTFNLQNGNKDYTKIVLNTKLNTLYFVFDKFKYLSNIPDSYYYNIFKEYCDKPSYL